MYEYLIKVRLALETSVMNILPRVSFQINQVSTVPKHSFPCSAFSAPSTLSKIHFTLFPKKRLKLVLSFFESSLHGLLLLIRHNILLFGDLAKQWHCIKVRLFLYPKRLLFRVDW
jgi:hypothetical protein